LILNFNSYSKEDSLPIPVFAVINSENTFCQTERTKNSLIYFQTYFNIYQKHAKFLESKINSVSTSSEVIHLFNNQKKRLAKEIWKFKSDTQEGKYISTLNEWNISTKAELQKYGK
jgi:AAA+ ATPase superfamily predicted ATPase